MATLYVDWKNGNDAADGSSGSPLKTLAHCLASHANNNDTILLRGSDAADEIYYEYALSTALTGLTIAADTGHSPTFTPAVAHTSWSLTDGQSFTYETAYTPAGIYYAWNGATLLTLKASIAEVEGLENSYFADVAGDKLYVHIAGGGSPSTIHSAYSVSALLSSSAAGITYRGLRMQWCGGGLRFDVNGTADSCTVRYHGGAALGSRYCYWVVAAVTVTFKNCQASGHGYVTGALEGTIGFRNASSSGVTLTFSNCKINDCHYGINTLANGTYVVEGCTFINCLDGVLADTSGTYVIRRSLFVDCIHASILFDASTTGTVHHTVCYITADVTGAYGYGIVWHNNGTNYGHHNIIANYKLGVSSSGAGFWLAPKSGVLTLHAANNVFLSCKVGINKASSVGTVTYDLSNNAFYDNTYDFADVDPGDQGTGNVTTDPLFVNPGNYDFRLLPTSPLIDAGALVTGVNEGFRGGAPDIGAFEYVRPVRHGRR